MNVRFGQSAISIKRSVWFRLLKIKDKSNKVKFVLTDDSDEPVNVDDLIIKEWKKKQQQEEEKKKDKKD